MGLRLSQSERATVAQAEAIKRLARKRDKAARLPKVAPLRTEKPHNALRERRPRQRDNRRLQWVRRLPCIVSAARGVIMFGCDAAHVRHGYPEPGWRYVGKAEKPDDFRAVPLTRAEHERQHSMSEAAYWVAEGLYPPALIASLTRSYEAGQDGPEVVLRAIQEGRR